MELSLVIPVWNDRDGVIRLLQQIGEWDCFSQIIIVDDASDEELSPDNLPGAQGLRDRISHLRIPDQRGAGHARNAGLDLVQGDHVIFFDSDDLFSNDFVPLVRLASGHDFDFLIFRHNDSRMTDIGQTGTFPNEEGYWTAIEATPQPRLLGPSQAAILCRLANYPWNKIYRTAFLRDNRIRCTETMVHNDIELHWASFLRAQRIFCSSMIGAEHVVSSDGNRLTNRRSAARLEAFDTLGRLARQINTLPGEAVCRFGPPFFRFARDLQDWIGGNIDEIHQPLLQSHARGFYLDHLNADLMTLIACRDPGLALRISRTVRGEGAA